MNQKKTFSGKTLEDALFEAAHVFGVESSAIGYTILSDGKTGNFLSRMFSRGVRIEAWVENSAARLKPLQDVVRSALLGNLEEPAKPNRAPGRGAQGGRDQKKGSTNPTPTPRPANAQPQRMVDFGQEPKILEQLKTFTADFFSIYGETKNKISYEMAEPNVVHVNIDDERWEAAFAQTDRIPQAFEQLFKRTLQNQFGDLDGKVVLKARDSIQKHQDYYAQFALEVADKVTKNRKSVTLNSKSSHERRIIHTTLQGHETVSTKSLGSGDDRKLMVFPKTQNQHKNPAGPRNNGGHQPSGNSQGRRPAAPRQNNNRRPQKNAEVDSRTGTDEAG